MTFRDPSGNLYMINDRIWHINSVHESHFNCSPCYTYTGNGIAKKSDALKKEHIGILPQHMKMEEYKKQNEYDPIEVTYMKTGAEKLSEVCYIHFTQQQSVGLNTAIRIVGYTKGSARIIALRARFGCT